MQSWWIITGFGRLAITKNESKTLGETNLLVLMMEFLKRPIDSTLIEFSANVYVVDVRLQRKVELEKSDSDKHLRFRELCSFEGIWLLKIKMEIPHVLLWSPYSTHYNLTDKYSIQPQQTFWYKRYYLLLFPSLVWTRLYNTHNGNDETTTPNHCTKRMSWTITIWKVQNYTCLWAEEICGETHFPQNNCQRTNLFKYTNECDKKEVVN